MEIESDLSEWDYGAYEGLRTADIQRERPAWNVWRDGCPDGEMPDDVSARADRLIARIAALQPQMNAQIAELRGSAQGTVKSQLNAIYRKAGVSGRTALLALLIEDLMGDPLIAETSVAA